MRFLFFLLIIGIVYYFVKYIFRGLFAAPKKKPFKAEKHKPHINIKEEDIVEAEFEEIEVDKETTEKDKTE